MTLDVVIRLKTRGMMRIELGVSGRTDGRTDGQTDGRTDKPAYRDARTHLKSKASKFNPVCILPIRLVVVIVIGLLFKGNVVSLPLSRTHGRL